jgi:hypothetical protein
MASSMCCSGRATAWTLALLFGLQSSGIAQRTPEAPANPAPPLGVLNAIGYGGLGVGLGALSGTASCKSGCSWDEEIGSVVGRAVLGAAAGLIGGDMIGNGARRKLARGEPLGTGHSFAVASVVVLAGATLGALAAVPLIAPSGEGTPLGSDEQTFALLATGGATLGALYLASRWKRI